MLLNKTVSKIRAHNQKLFVDNLEQIIYECSSFITNSFSFSKKNKSDPKLVKNFIFDLTVNILSSSLFHGLEIKDWGNLAASRKTYFECKKIDQYDITSTINQISIDQSGMLLSKIFILNMNLYFSIISQINFAEVLKHAEKWATILDDIFVFDEDDKNEIILNGTIINSINEFIYSITKPSYVSSGSNRHQLLEDYIEKLKKSISITCFEGKKTLIYSTRLWADLKELILINLTILIAGQHSIGVRMVLSLPYALSNFGREKIDWRCQLNFHNYILISNEFKVYPNFVSELGYSLDNYKSSPKVIAKLKYSFETSKYPIVFISQNFLISTRLKNCLKILFMAIRYNLGVRIKPHPKNRFKIIERIFCFLPKLAYEYETNINIVFENSLFVVGAYSNSLLVAANSDIITYSCKELDQSFPTSYSYNLIENGVKITTLNNAFHEIYNYLKK